ncbi:MAG: OmpA family protein [Lewinella sp.]|uniref:OmpA family protein n=1 Tax=Lewinella sp. TaxID=2004506 RepID=UPI003D6B9122
MKNTLLFCLAFLVKQAAFGQNLVPNPGFEYCVTPINNWILSDISFNKLMINWFSPNSGSPDILQKPELGRMRNERPNVDIDTYSPRNGNVMIGLKLVGCNDGDHCKEYLQVALKEHLEIGEKYYFEVWTKPIRTSIKVNNIGMLFSMDKIERFGEGIFDYQPMLNVDGVLDNSVDNDWVKISDTICADSSYQYLVIGNFFLDRQTQKIAAPGGIDYAYYLFDDAMLVKIGEDCNRISSIMNTKNIQFETNSSNLKIDAFGELNKLIAFLEDHPDKEIRIEGHTDNVGTSADNQKLSSDRANAVLEYLVEKAIARDRLMAVGKGDTVPIATNANEEGRRINRRVEIVILN